MSQQPADCLRQLIYECCGQGQQGQEQEEQGTEQQHEQQQGQQQQRQVSALAKVALACLGQESELTGLQEQVGGEGGGCTKVSVTGAMSEWCADWIIPRCKESIHHDHTQARSDAWPSLAHRWSQAPPSCSEAAPSPCSCRGEAWYQELT